MPTDSVHTIAALRKELLLLQGFKPVNARVPALLSGAMADAFPNGVFPLGAVHQFISRTQEQKAASLAFGLSAGSPLMQTGATVWISDRKQIFPPGLAAYDIDPHRILFVSLQHRKQLLSATEDALNCGSVSIVISEIRELNFTESRRLQLATEKTKATAFLFTHQPKNLNTTAAVSRWIIEPYASLNEDALPGVGLPRWKLTLEKVRNGKPGSWIVHRKNNNWIYEQEKEQQTNIQPLRKII